MSTTTISEASAQIGKTISVRGEISGSEDMRIDGQVDGSIQLNGNSLTIGPNGRIHANITAKDVIVSGSIDGNIQVTGRTEMHSTAVVNGDVQTRRIAIEEGAYFKGKLEILAESKLQTAPGTASAASSTPFSAPKSGAPGPGK